MKVAATTVTVLALTMVASAQLAPCKLSNTGEPSAQQRQHWEQLKTQPDHTLVLYNMAYRYALLGNTATALSLLQKALASNPWLDPSQDAIFKDLAGCPEFQAMVARVQKSHPPVATSKVVLTVGPKDLLPEGMAVDAHDGTMYFSSIYHRKIVRVSPDKTQTDLVSEGQDGLLSVLGVKVDPRDRSIWAASQRTGHAALYHFTRTGKLLAKFAPQEAGDHLFNDLVVTTSGDVYVTDSTDKSVYHLVPKRGELTRISLGDRYYPNGIALSTDEKTIYIAHAFGIATMKRGTGNLGELQPLPGTTVGEIDGLYYWRGKLIAIQNGSGGNRIAQFSLAADGHNITGARLLEWRSDNLQLPTTGAIYDSYFYFMVNTQIDHDDNGKLKDPEKLQPVKIARLKLQ
jgi:hypothetical protein